MVSSFLQDHPGTDDPVRPAGAHDAAVELVSRALGAWRRISLTERGIMVTTDCLYSDGTSVVVAVVGARHGETVVVHDDGGAEDRLAASGRRLEAAAKILARVARKWRLKLEGFRLTAGHVSVEDLPALVPIVANASREAAEALLGASAPRVRRDLVGEVIETLHRRMPDRHLSLNYEVGGESRRPYHFDVAVSVREGVTLLVETVSPNARSVNEMVAANVDIGRRHDHKFSRIMVYDPEQQERFKSGSLSLLASVGPAVVPVDSFEGELDRSMRLVS